MCGLASGVQVKKRQRTRLVPQQSKGEVGAPQADRLSWRHVRVNTCLYRDGTLPDGCCQTSVHVACGAVRLVGVVVVVSKEYKTLITIEWCESQTYILQCSAPSLTACRRNLCVQWLTR